MSDPDASAAALASAQSGLASSSGGRLAGTIGIDDGNGRRKPRRVGDERERASQLAGASRAVLEHLAMAGPLTIGEAAAHLSRAQSVVSEIVSHLVDQGLLDRETDPASRTRSSPAWRPW